MPARSFRCLARRHPWLLARWPPEPRRGPPSAPAVPPPWGAAGPRGGPPSGAPPPSSVPRRAAIHAFRLAVSPPSKPYKAGPLPGFAPPPKDKGENEVDEDDRHDRQADG